MATLEELQFDNHYARLPAEFHDKRSPEPLHNGRLASFNPAAAQLLELSSDQGQREDFIDFFTGARHLPGAEPLAMCYSGHQFGTYVPRLGDGRAILLGQVKTSQGASWDMQVKGSGPTLYSRMGDGRAVLRSSIREYLCSEAMHGLGIPTTRALCLISSEERIVRETIEPGAMVVRLAESHIRFGSFEYFFYTKQHDYLTLLADYIIERHYPELVPHPEKYALLLETVIERTATLIAQWQGVGFAHGVMNSDNMSILGLTLDYGPFGFLDAYQAGFVCNHSDHQGRYAFDQQPNIGLFNLSCLAQALLPLLDRDGDGGIERAKAALKNYWPEFKHAYLTVIHSKLGLQSAHSDDLKLWGDLLATMEKQTDYTRFFRALAQFDRHAPTNNTTLRDMFIDREAFDAWAQRYSQRLNSENMDDQRRAVQMNQANPKYVLRNYLAETAIRRAQDEHDFSEMERLLTVLRSPYDEQPEMARYAAQPPDWAQSISVSCSS